MIANQSDGGHTIMVPDACSLVQRVDLQRLRADVAALAREERNSRSNAAHHVAAQAYIRSAFVAAGLEVRQHTFTHAGRSGVNLLARPAGSGPTRSSWLVSAHYDTVPGSPGADDNASGVAALLECARVVGAAPIEGIEFVAFDMEERQPDGGEGLIGSSAFVRGLASAEEYRGVFNLEMVGFTSGPGGQRLPPGFQLLFPGVYRQLEERRFIGDSVAVVASGKSAALSRRLATAAARHVPDLAVIPLEVPEGAPIPPDVFRSDHASFWAAGIPAVMITDTANFRNPYYHLAEDTADTVDYTFLHRITCALVAALAEKDDG